MPPRRRARSASGWLGVRERSGRFSAEISCRGNRLWLGTFDTPELAARAFDVAAWRFGRPRRLMNFPECETLAEAELLAPEVRYATAEEEREHRWAMQQIAVNEADERRMARYAEMHPEEVQAELDFYARKEDAEKKKKRKERGPGSSSRPVPVDSDDSEGWLDYYFGSSSDADDAK